MKVRSVQNPGLSKIYFSKPTVGQNVLGQLDSWYFEPSQPLGIISGLKETFIKRYVLDRTNKAEITPEEQSEKTESCWENLRKEIQLNGPERQKQTQEQNKQEWARSFGLCL